MNYEEKLARVMTRYSLELKPGQIFKIQGEPVALPLIKALYKDALELDALPYTEIVHPEIQETFYKNARERQLKTVPFIREFEISKIDAIVSIWGTTNTRQLAGVDPQKQAIFANTTRPMMMKFFQRVADGQMHWCGTQYPTAAHAQEAEMSLDDYCDFVYRAGHLNDDDPVAFWRSMDKEQNRLAAILNQVDKIRFRAEGTDLSMRVAGRKWINCSGKENFPDGEIFSTPLEDSVNGTIRFTYPGYYYGREVDGIKLTFRDGVVSEFSALKNEAFLKAMLETDPGAKRVGEIAIGTNYEITRFTRNTLFDEKIGGTCHLALGAAPPETGSTNQSGIHWDIVCDFKQGGEIEADGKVIYRNGKFEI